MQRLGAVVIAVLAGCRPNASGGSAEGPTLFEAMCSRCHGPTGKPTEGMVAQLNVKDLTAPELRARITPELVEDQVRRGSANKLMPPFEGVLTEQQIEAVAAWVASPEFMAR
jgi:mono/diheme cytochrome c family protein